MTRTEDGQAKPYMNFLVKSIGAKVNMRVFDMHAMISLGGMEVEHLHYKGE